ncbi:MAG: membrane protein insertion efficiency factor YidD [Rickettsiales bacterium]|nr:membrane protein insertion efficiency factor YidD [Rickettsiales bacterium]
MHKFIAKIITQILIFFVRLYQILISPFISYDACRFNPSCSEYMLQSLAKQGFVKGLYNGIRRLLRCHPWSVGGNDPIK